MDYRAEVKQRLMAEGVLDDSFIETFLDQEGDLTPELENASNEGPAHVEDTLRGIVEAAKERLHYWKAGDTLGARSESGEIRPKRKYKRRSGRQTADAWERQEAAARYLAGRMHPNGSALIGGKLLCSEEAAALLDSPLAASYPTAFISRYGLDAMLNPAVVEEDAKGLYKVVRAQRGSETRTFKIRSLGYSTLGLAVFPGDKLGPLEAVARPTTKVKYVASPRDPNQHIATRANSVLARLARAADRLGGALHPISPENALWFILTGEFVPEPPVRIKWEQASAHGWYKRTRISIEVEGWLTAEEVAAQYRHAQRQVFGRTPRSLAAKSCALLDFARENSAETWQEIYERWNKEHPAWRFKQVGHLHQLHKRALGKLAGLEN